MKITQDKILKQTLIKRYWKLTRKVLIQTRQAILDKSEYIDPERLKEMVPDLLLSRPMFNHLINLWSDIGGRFAYDTEKMFNQGKKLIIDLEQKKEPAKIPIGIPITTALLTSGLSPAEKLIYWQKRMRDYAYERSLQKTKQIMTTEQEAINSVIDKVISKVNAEGLSIPNARNLMRNELDTELVTIENWQAERIARTEVGGASNTGSFEAALENSEGCVKEWLTSGLPNTRESHLYYESLGPQELDYEFAPGLQFPSDENCPDAGDVINCRCTYTMEIVN